MITVSYSEIGLFSYTYFYTPSSIGKPILHFDAWGGGKIPFWCSILDI